MQARVRALEAEMTHLMEQVAAMAEAAESGQAGAEERGLELVAELQRLEQETAAERTRPESLQ